MNSNKTEDCEAILSALPDMVFVLTESGRYAAVLGGESVEQYHSGSFLEDYNLYDVLPKSKADWFIDKIKETLEANKLMIFEYSLSANDVDNIEHDSGPAGDLRFEGRVCPLKSRRFGEKAVVWVARNITQRYRLEQQLVQQSEIDVLSDAYNRRKLFEFLNSAFFTFQRYSQISSFIVIDLDNFKAVNDTKGHQQGDARICEFVSFCKSQLKEGDTFGRIGGDEFGIIYKGTPQEALNFANDLRESVGDRFEQDGLTMSAGISHFQESDSTIDQVYQRADIALYQAKRSGKNRCLSL